MKKLNKLSLKKVTLRNLDEAELEVIAGGCCPTVSFPRTCLCPTSANDTCAQKKG
ncbi:MAG TPA: TIGR04149 family rSAM-modified RiPP [Candidatus Angelobacter sp.]|nr:TIGR04149 family rSAM-modified RiPP [Candidatus Angelobacter sp.]